MVQGVKLIGDLKLESGFMIQGVESSIDSRVKSGL